MAAPSLTPQQKVVFEGQVRIHNILRRGFDSADQHLANYIQSEEKRAKLPHLLSYMRVVVDFLHGHHHSEDDVYFPIVSKKCNIDTSNFTQDHQKFVTDLETLEKTLVEVTAEGEKAETAKLQNLHQQWQSLKGIVFPHLAAEEQTFTPEKLAENFTPQEQIDLSKKLAEHGRANAKNPKTTLPYMIYNLTDDERGSFTGGMPWILRRMLIPYAWHSAWKNHAEYYYNYPGASF